MHINTSGKFNGQLFSDDPAARSPPDTAG
jgi:hypothetical protein